MSQNDHSIRTGIPAIVKCGRASGIAMTIRRLRVERAPPADERAPASRLRWGMGAQPPESTVDPRMTMRERYVVTNGIRVFCVEDGPRTGPLVLFVHGWPEFSWSWRHQLPALGASGYRAVALDLPGYGRSDKPDVSYD